MSPIAKQWTTKPKKMCKTGDVLFCVRGATAGRINLADSEYCIGRGLAAIRGSDGVFDTGFIRHVLANGYARFQSRGVGSTFINISARELASFPIPDLPLAEQKRIAKILDTADALRAKRRESLALLDELLRSTFLEMFGDPVANPKGWKSSKLIELCDSDRGISYGVVQRGAHQEEGIPLVRIGDILTGEVASDGLVRCSVDITSKYGRTELRGGELVISIRGTIGRVAEVPHSLNGGNITRELALIPLREGTVRPFVLELLRTEAVFRRLAEDVRGIAQRGINLRDLRALDVIQPPIEEQTHFASIFESVARQRTHQQVHMVELDNLFASLQQRAFRGEL